MRKYICPNCGKDVEYTKEHAFTFIEGAFIFEFDLSKRKCKNCDTIFYVFEKDKWKDLRSYY